jgi:hypothetical protein
MKWSLFFKEKMKAASFLAVLMIAIIASNVMESVIDHTNDGTVSSVYEDRLKPSIDLSEMKDLNYQRISIINQLRLGNEFNADSKEELARINQKFDLLLRKYQNTYLVAEEKVILISLVNDLKGLNQAIYSREFSAEKQIEDSLKKLNAINLSLSKLNKVQEIVGEELVSSYKEKTFLRGFLNTLQILIAIIIGFIILKMIAEARMLNLFDKKPIHLN